MVRCPPFLGASGSNDAEMLSILYNHGIEPEFPQEVIDEAEYVKIELDSEAEIKRRRRDFEKNPHSYY